MENQFEVKQDGTVLTIVLGKELNTANAPALMEEINMYRDKGIEKVIFDATSLSYISSSGIRVIIYAKQKVSGSVVIEFVNCAKEIRDVFSMVGIEDHITFVNK